MGTPSWSWRAMETGNIFSQNEPPASSSSSTSLGEIALIDVLGPAHGPRRARAAPGRPWALYAALQPTLPEPRL